VGAVPDAVTVSIRPEQMALPAALGTSNGVNRFVGKPIESTFLGAGERACIAGERQRMKVISAPPLFEVPGEMAIEFDPGDVVVLAE